MSLVFLLGLSFLVGVWWSRRGHDQQPEAAPQQCEDSDTTTLVLQQRLIEKLSDGLITCAGALMECSKPKPAAQLEVF